MSVSSANSSAGVYVQEVDLSARIDAVSSSVAAVLGFSRRGPVNQRTLITGVPEFRAMFGDPNPVDGYLHYAALAFLSEGNALYVTRVAPEALYGGAVVSKPGGANLMSGFGSGMADPTVGSFGSNDLFWVYAIDPGDWNSGINVTIIPETVLMDNTFFVEVRLNGSSEPVERFQVHMNFIRDGFGVQLNIQDHINTRSKYIRVRQNYANSVYAAHPDLRFINTIRTVNLTGGSDGNPPSTSDYIDAWSLYEDKEEVIVNLLINGGLTNTDIQAKMVQICKDRMDCMAILDVPSDQQALADAIDWRRNSLNIDSSYAALYSPDILILDSINDRRLFIPPSGPVAAVYAKTDRDAATWYAPAGMTRGDIKALGLRHSYDLSAREILVPSQINPIKIFAGQGIKVWGSDTLQIRASALSNVSVRRLMMFIESAVSVAVLYSVFDPNDPLLRAQLTEITERFLKPLKNDGRALYDFRVECSDKNNPPSVVSQGILNLDVYLDPVLPAKQIILNGTITQTGGLKFSQA
jgi:hypothetical protein